MITRRHILAISALTMATPIVRAQSDRPIRLMVGFPAGGSIDTVARVLADKMKDDLRQPIVIENKPGAGGRLAAELLKNAAPDSGIYMITPVVVPVLAPLVFSKLNYNPQSDFTPVGHVFKNNSQKASFGSPAAGSLPHFFGLLLGREAQVDIIHVAYNGGAPLQTAVIGDQVPAGIDVVLEWLQNHKAGKVRVIATSGMTRSRALPDVPTFREQGYPNIVGGGWFAVYAPAKAPAAEIERVNRALNKALAMPDVNDKFLSLGLETGGGSPADLIKLMDTDTQRWGPIVKASGFRAD